MSGGRSTPPAPTKSLSSCDDDDDDIFCIFFPSNPIRTMKCTQSVDSTLESSSQESFALANFASFSVDVALPMNLSSHLAAIRDRESIAKRYALAWLKFLFRSSTVLWVLSILHVACCRDSQVPFKGTRISDVLRLGVLMVFGKLH